MFDLRKYITEQNDSLKETMGEEVPQAKRDKYNKARTWIAKEMKGKQPGAKKYGQEYLEYKTFGGPKPVAKGAGQNHFHVGWADIIRGALDTIFKGGTPKTTSPISHSTKPYPKW